MKLWTFHPAAFRLDDPTQSVDHTRGMYWNDPNPNLRDRYRSLLPLLHQRLATDQFLWCDTVDDFRGHFEEADEIGWELTLQSAEVLAYYRVMVWEDMLWKGADGWDRLFIVPAPAKGWWDIGALVRFPVPSDGVRCLGKPRPRTVRPGGWPPPSGA